MSKRKGYLLIDVSIALVLFSILSITIFTFYNKYTVMRKNNLLRVSYIEKFNAITMEAKHNITFGEFNELEKGKRYNISVDSVNDIMNNSLLDLIDVEKSINEESCTLMIIPSDDIDELIIEINYYNEQGNFKYENNEIIRRYSFLK